MLITLLFALGACRAEPPPTTLLYPKETEGVNHEAQYRIVVKGSVINVNGLDIEAKKRTVRDLAVLNNGKPIQQGFLRPDYYNSHGIGFFAIAYKDGVFGEAWSEAEYQQWPIVAVNIYLQQTKLLESHPCTNTEYKKQREEINKRNEKLRLEGALGRVEQITRKECDSPKFAFRPTNPYSGYLEVDGLALPVGRKVSYAEIQERRRTLGLPPLEGHVMDEGGTIFHGYAKNRDDGLQTWMFEIPPEAGPDREGTQRYLEQICVGDCP